MKVLTYDLDREDAFHAVLGYAFCARPFVWRKPRRGTGAGPEAQSMCRWAYRTYDCVEPHPDEGLAGIDLFVAAGLNARLDASAVASLIAVEPEVSAALRHLPPRGAGPSFWELNRDHLHGRRPSSDSAEWPLWRAWTVMMGAPDIGVALTHKTLHHKRPDMFPLIDNRTLAAFGKDAWAELHDDLTDGADDWEHLELRFADQAATHGVALTRLRLHDILLWTNVSGEYDDALTAGRAIASELDDEA